jgi:hypothetical protein
MLEPTKETFGFTFWLSSQLQIDFIELFNNASLRIIWAKKARFDIFKITIKWFHDQKSLIKLIKQQNYPVNI